MICSFRLASFSVSNKLQSHWKLTLISGTFMICCMAGSSVFSIVCDHYRGEKLAAVSFAVAAASMALIASSSSTTLKFLAMNLFEMTVGMYWPIMGTLKGAIVPESMRAAIYNIYRIPLNFIVLFSLLTDIKPSHAFALNALMLTTATVLMIVLMKRREKNGMTSHSEAPQKADPDTPLLESEEKV